MKIGDDSAAAVSRPASQANATRQAGAWQAQLERAWMDAWRNDQAPAKGPADPPRQERAPQAAAERQGQREELPSSDRRLDGGSAECTRRPLQPQAPGIDAQAAARPATGQSVPARKNAVAGPAPSTEERVALAASSPAAGDAGDAAACAETHERHGAPASREQGAGLPRSALQVAVVGNAAQVTLRDAALTAIDASRVPEAIAHQLLESGLRSVRLYVNGRLSHHGLPADRKTSDSGTGADPFHIPSLERK